MFTYFPPVCPVTTATTTVMNSPVPAAQAQFPTFSAACLQVTTGILTQVAGCNAAAQAATPAAQTLPPITIPADCGVSWNCGAGPAQAQFPTLSLACIGPATRVLTQVAGCNGAAAQAVAPAAQTLPPITIPADCGVSWNCGAGPAQAQFPTLSLECGTRVLTQVAGCNGAAAQAVAPAAGHGLLSSYPCPTVAQCYPTTTTTTTGAAQAQFPTLSVACITITTTVTA